MRVAIASDHGGFLLKQHVVDSARQLGHDAIDLGTYGPEPVDYPDQAEILGLEVTSGRAERGILLCGSGVGAVFAVNKLPGVRAGLCHDTYSAHQGVEHDDMNVLVMGGLVVGTATAQRTREGLPGRPLRRRGAAPAKTREGSRPGGALRAAWPPGRVIP